MLPDGQHPYPHLHPRGLLVEYIPNMRPHRLIRGTAIGRAVTGLSVR
ncbi:unnamed protein product [[Actinomadura] parvosata subsp. kistnae]|nr:unnamed protein product [Actinomadura parvosata subsp. kistnae]